MLEESVPKPIKGLTESVIGSFKIETNWSEPIRFKSEIGLD